ncbi:isoprenoid synthase domain-containing protein [Apiosordaria backusii]|uniref:Terpene synthase n=1 Tax=Apiosordaria backusii TaxID=314023 RepID=A0AA40ES90_9PEZI|nr:isoprenoid synthase domain-containing protein [Apiosordaria backusii]
MPYTQETPVSQLAAQLKGQTLHLPSIEPVLSNWPTTINPYYHELKKKVAIKIDEWISDEKVRRKAQVIDLPLFSSTWYPYATPDRLETITWYSMWIFLWDDVIEESATPSSGITDKVPWIHQQALRYMEYHLGLSSDVEEPAAPTKYCTLFKYAAEPFRKASNLLQRMRLYEELKVYMEACEVEQEFVRAGDLPNLKEYWEHRLGTSSVHTYSALGEYMSGGSIPPGMFDRPELRELWVGINRHIVTVNDLISFKKEVVKSSFHSLIPIAMNETGADLDTVVDGLVDTLHTIGDSMDQAGNTLIAVAERDHGLQGRKNMEKYVKCFQTCATGNYWWSLFCGRYGVQQYLQPDGSLVVPL